MKKVALLVLAAAMVPAAASAQQIVLSGNNVVGASSVYAQGAGNVGAPFVANGTRVTGTWGAGALFNSQLTSPTTENFGSGEYFLTGDGESSPTVPNPYVTIDLGGLFSLASFTLFGTSNGYVNDRGTAGFTILGASGAIVDGLNGLTLAGPITTLVTGTLNQQVYGSPPAAQSFGSLSAVGVRYIQFVPTSATASRLYNAQSYGLNELKVFGDVAVAGVPEPASWGLMLLGFGAMGVAIRRKPRTRTTVAFVTAG